MTTSLRDGDAAESKPEECLNGGGEMGALMRSINWEETPLGPVSSWPSTLRSMVRVMLGNRFPMMIGWGPHLLQLYNDGYRPILGDKHPKSMGQPCAQCWSEVWDIVGPLLLAPLNGGPATWDDDLDLEINRYGFLEEVHFVTCYSPIPDESGGIGGVLVTVSETTEQVEDARQLKTLRELAGRSAEAKTAEEACRIAAQIMAKNPADIPFALLYLTQSDGKSAKLVGAAGFDNYGGRGAPDMIPLDHCEYPDSWPLANLVRSGERLVLTDIERRFGRMPSGKWSGGTSASFLIPLQRASAQYGFLIVGISPRRRFDDRYRGFFEMAADHVMAALSNAIAYQVERQRAEALAEIDRAKTYFFSNVSHEFRTPLTLILGSLEDAIQNVREDEARISLLAAQRNSLRLLKLVNTLLDFSRIEAKRMEASFEPTDIAELTRDLASAFESLLKRAGLAFNLEIDELSEPAYVDREMWEKIVLNLISNAFKFTLQGVITVGLHRVTEGFELTVTDTGSGIPEHELSRLFERFHRIEGMPSRTYEGSGIGLALVQELVKMHGGTIQVESQVGQGTRFTIMIPAGHAHLDPDRIHARRSLARKVTGADPFLQEASRWLIDADEPVLASAEQARLHMNIEFAEDDYGARILLADDNADMRHYIKRLLGGHYLVETAVDGMEALRMARQNPPDIILTDVMMPYLDGLGLLRELRADPRTQSIPVIVLSARAGEEAQVEGFERGADDYLVKPFSARELVAKISSRLQLNRLRTEALKQVEAARKEAEEANRAKDEFLAMLGHELRNPLASITTALKLLQLRGNPSMMREREVIERQTQLLVRLVDDLLDASRITRGKIQLRKQHIELARIVANAIEVVIPLIEQRQHTLDIAIPSSGLLLEADPMRLEQVVVNLLTNAAKYTEMGGKIAIWAVQEERQVLLRVCDNGIGIMPELLPRVFDLFIQGNRVSGRAEGGLGIGLTIVKSLVRLHGGTVEVFSEGPGKGSEFVVRLPLVQLGDALPPGTAGDVSEMPPSAISGKTRRVLIVDDNQDAAELLAELLKAAGHSVAVAYDGPSALRIAPELKPEVMLIDIGLPSMNGYELAHRLKAIPELGNAWLLALTGYDQETDRKRTLEAGFRDHLVKPIDLVRLESILESIHSD
jgi:signal transduction histidine kinase